MADVAVAPPPAAPAPVPATTDTSASLGSLVKAAGEQAQQDAGLTQPPTPAAAAPADGTLPTETAEPGVVSEPASETAPTEDYTIPEEVVPDSQSQDGKTHFYSETKSRRLQAANKFVQGLQEFMPAVSVDAVKEAVYKANAADALMANFRLQAMPEVPFPERQAAMQTVLNMFQEDSPVSFGVMAISALSQLPQVNPEAYRTVVNVQNNRLLQQQRDLIHTLGDPEARNQQAIFVQNLEQRLTGRFTTKEELLRARTVDPVQQRLHEVERRERVLREQEQGNQQRALQERVNWVNGQEDMAFQQELDRVLGPVKANFTPEDLGIMTQRFLNAISEAERAKEEWGIRYSNLRSEALRTGSERDIQSLVDFRRSVWRSIMRANAQRIINGRTASRVTGVTANGAGVHTEPSPNGVPVATTAGGLDAAMKAKDWKGTFSNLWPK